MEAEGSLGGRGTSISWAADTGVSESDVGHSDRHGHRSRAAESRPRDFEAGVQFSAHQHASRGVPVVTASLRSRGLDSEASGSGARYPPCIPWFVSVTGQPVSVSPRSASDYRWAPANAPRSTTVCFDWCCSPSAPCQSTSDSITARSKQREQYQTAIRAHVPLFQAELLPVLPAGIQVLSVAHSGGPLCALQAV